MVLATAVPKTNAATKFQNAAHATARKGVRTRVETTVAMEFAASCQPFENSNASVNMMTARRRLNGFTWSGALQHYAFYHIGDIFALIDGGLDDFKNLFPFDDLNRIGFFIEELRDQCPAETITLILKAIDFDAVFESFIPVLDCVYQCSDFGTRFQKNLGEVGSPVSHRVHPVENETTSGGVNQVNDVVERGAQFVNILPVNRCNESLVELPDNGVRNLITCVLDGLNALYLLVDRRVTREHVTKSLRALLNILRLPREEQEIIIVAG